MIKIWISGTSGFVGKRLLIYLNSLKKYNVKAVSNSVERISKKIFLDYSSEKELNKKIQQMGSPDIFLHLGWGDVYDPHSKKHLNQNLSEGKKLFKCFYANGTKKIILIGSSSEYGGSQGRLKEDLEISTFQNLYVEGKHKLAEFGIKEAKLNEKLFLHVRLFYAYGAGQRENSLINQLFFNAIHNKAISLTPCDHFRDYIYIDDVVTGIEKLFRFKQSQIVNLGSGNAIQLRKFVEKFWKKLNNDLTLLKFGSKGLPLKQQLQPRAYADLSKLENITNWIPQINVDEGISKTINLLKK